MAQDPGPDAAAFFGSLGIDPSQMPRGGAAAEPKVYLGEQKTGQYVPLSPRVAERDPSAQKRRIEATRPKELDESVAKLEPYRWTEEQRQAFWQQMARAGLVGEDDYSFTKLVAMWERFVNDSINSTAVGKQITPWDAMSLYAGAGDKLGPRTTTSRSTSVNLTTAETARSLLTRMLSNKFGRDANEDEVDDFLEALNTYERAHPSVTTTTQTVNALGDASNVSTKTSGGADAGAYAEQYAEDDQFDEEHKYVQATSTYYNALLAGLRAPV